MFFNNHKDFEHKKNKNTVFAAPLKILTLLLLLAVVTLIYGCCSSDNESGVVMVSAVESSSAVEPAKPAPKPSKTELEIRSAAAKFNLSWTKSKNATGYEIYISSDGKNYELLSSTNVLAFETEELTPDKTYYFRITPFNSQPGQKTVYGDPTETSAVCVEGAKIDGYDVGDTYVHIDIDEQTMWFYKNNKLLVETPIVTGTAGACDTPTGYFEVRTLASPAHLVGPTWDVTTDYWIGINLTNDIGIHDSPWRENGYGGNIYTYDGSNGCINTPLDAVKTIYENITIGTPVVITSSVDVSYSNTNDYALDADSDTVTYEDVYGNQGDSSSTYSDESSSEDTNLQDYGGTYGNESYDYGSEYPESHSSESYDNSSDGESPGY